MGVDVSVGLSMSVYRPSASVSAGRGSGYFFLNLRWEARSKEGIGIWGLGVKAG